MKNESISRRSFVSGAAQMAFGAMVVPRHVLGGVGYVAPSAQLNIAMIGAGGMGASNAYALVAGGQNIVALADVDFRHVDRGIANRGRNNDGSTNEAGVRMQQMYASARRYADFREMLDREGRNIDAVVIATPDHVHAAAAAHAMRLGKHVYVQKPLTYSVYESRVLRDLAARGNIVTQMGNQGHSTEGARLVNEWVQAGVIGTVREVEVWTNRPIWPQGVPRPTTALLNGQEANWGSRNLDPAIAAAMAGDYTAPEGVNWDLFLGPAPWVEYHPIYHPFNWRGWFDWGVGAIGDMGAHLIDHPFWALELGLPTSIEATLDPVGRDVDQQTPATYPQAMTVHYEFAARGNRPAVKLNWYDGGLMPPRPDVLPDDVILDRSGGVIFKGERGILMHETYGNNPRLYPESLMQEAARVPKTYERVDTSHEMNWANAAMGQGKAVSPFEYAAPLTETMLLGIVALRAGQGRKIYYDGENMRVTNVPEANAFLHREYRPGWNLI